MKVGIVVPGSAETVGGGSTFEKDVLGALLDRILESEHQPVLLGWSPKWTPSIPSRVPYFPLRPRMPFSKRLLAKGGRGVRRLRHIARNILHGPQPHLDDVTIVQTLQTHRIEFLVHLNTGVVSCCVPYLAVVWDLQHRLQPYFPEISADGIWEHRTWKDITYLSRATWLVTGTNVGKGEIEKYVGVSSERIAVLPLPTPADALAYRRVPGNSVLGRYGLKEPFLFYPAQFWPHKNHITLLKALRILRERDNLRPLLVLTGSDFGNLAHVQAKSKEWGLLDQVRFLGFVPRSALLELCTEARALVYPSAFGPDNIPPLEAFALGCPVAYGNVAGAKEQLGEAALVTSLFDAEAWASAIRSLWTDEALRKRLKEAGRARAERWTSKEVARGIIDLLDRFAPVRELWNG